MSRKAVSKVPGDAEWITVNEAALLARVSVPAIYRWIQLEWIDSYILKTRAGIKGGKRMIRRSSIKDLIERQFREHQAQAAKMAGAVKDLTMTPAD